MSIKQVTVILVFFTLGIAFGQEKLSETILEKHSKKFETNNDTFSGEGWDFITDKVGQSDNVLIGEDHFTNEIPLFVKRIFEVQKFDNFYIEVDPYSAAIIESSITQLSKKERETFNNEYKDLFSFYALPPEYELLKGIVQSGIKLYGADQIIMYADRLIFQKLIKETTNAKARMGYKEIIEKSEAHLSKFLENPQNPMYLTTPEFSEKIKVLQKLPLTESEQEILSAMLKSVDIYASGPEGHRKRVKLLKHQLMENYDGWKNKKNLFKYGANHLTKGESLLTVYDIGNLINNISEANNKKPLHIMVIGQKGMLGSPLRVFPPQPVQTSSWPLRNLSTFLNAENGKWKVYDLNSLEENLKKQEVPIEDVTLRRIIKGYDLLIVIPEVTAAKF